jgi:hypothetical protein
MKTIKTKKALRRSSFHASTHPHWNTCFRHQDHWENKGFDAVFVTLNFPRDTFVTRKIRLTPIVYPIR